MLDKFFKKDGFTLAEVLVTLAVIGIVCALTIPSLIKNSQNAEAASKLKKAISTLNQAFQMYAAENNCTGDLSTCGAFTGNENSTGHQQAWNGIKPHLKLAKDCGIATGQGCFAKGVIYKLLNGNDYNEVDNLAFGKGILADGTSILIGDYNGNCTSDRSRYNSTPLQYSCARIHVDINGYKGPNQYGRDTFYLLVTKSGVIYPGGHPDDVWYSAADGTPYCDPDIAGDNSTPGGGLGCAGRIMLEGKVNY